MRLSLLTLQSLMAISAIGAQTADTTAARSPKHALYSAYTLAKRQLLAAADTMPEDGYAARHGADIRSFGEIIGHVVETNFGVCAGTRKEANPRAGQLFDGVVTAKPALLALLRESFAYCDPLLSELPPGAPGGTDLTFLATHTAQMVVAADTYLALRGILPKATEVARKKPK